MSEKMQQQITQAEQDLLHTYNRFPVVFDHAEGMSLYDTDGKRYLDFFSGIGVFALGHGSTRYKNAVKAQVDKLLHTSNYFYNEPAIDAARKLKAISGMDRVFFTNSGAEAVEGALKAARKYAYLRDGVADHEIIAMEGSFHGRTMGALSVTGTKKYRDPFEPLIGGVRFAKYNDIESVKALLTDKTCAIIMETVQGEGGIHPADPAFIKEIRRICDEKDILLILDEIQCGMGRTGTMYAWQGYDVRPDIMTTAKALGCGVPVGAFLLQGKAADRSLAAGDHGTTYGGNPLACAAISEVLSIYEEEKILDHVNMIAPYLTELLDTLAEKRDDIKERRGIGLMQGLEFTHPVGDILNRALDKGLVLINAGANVLRFLPPLVIGRSEVDEMMDILKASLD
ncbi:MAG: aspartate aminotransferase family protein [Lachnospiraceae bacterium]|nr:aspartate aminotransferase family protein [Lachnospiraceae bacterium]